MRRDSAGEPPGGPTDPGRREFLKLVGATAGAAAAAAVLPSGAIASPERVEELAREHANDPGMLIDLSKCIGCGACVTACKFQNDLTWRQDQPWLGPDAQLASANWTVVRTFEPETEPSGSIRYAKRQCMHCLEPACASACPVRALRKEPNGPVTYDVTRCIGCRYCLVACPFSVPTFEWDRPISKVSKCNLCFQRVSHGEATACAASCPVRAITFGKRGELLEKARATLAADPERYMPRIYGEKEVGGTSVLYISDATFPEVGFREGLPTEPIPDYTWQVSRLALPVAATVGAVLTTIWVRRSRALERGAAAPSASPDGEKPGGTHA
ncbi:MAG: 4Fe-4S dicluster domain-containing protein [Acidobacteria bacterium]|nr:4Fe-4S dicluster domain-containing protein [Acidobacteriota bacterium]